MSRHRSRRAPARALSFIAKATLVAGAFALIPTPASASPTLRPQSAAELQARAKDLADRLDHMNMRSDQLDEQYNDARLEVTKLQDQLAQNQAAVDAAKAALGDGQALAKKYAIDAYVSGGSVGTELSQQQGSDDAGRRQTYLSVLQGNKQQVLADLDASRQDLADKEAELAAAKQRVDDKVAAVAKAKQELTQSIAEQTKLLDDTKGQLGAALAAEQQRRVRAAAAAAAQQLARQAAAEQAARARPATVRVTGNATPATTTTRGGEDEETDGGSGSDGPEIAFPDVAASGAAATAIAAARSQLGVPYRWGGATPGVGFDCSGLIMWSYAKAGRSLPHSSRALYSMTQRLSAGELQPGDLVFGGSPVHHVGLYIGNGLMIHAPHSGDVVRIASIYSTSKPVTFGRL